LGNAPGVGDRQGKRERPENQKKQNAEEREKKKWPRNTKPKKGKTSGSFAGAGGGGKKKNGAGRLTLKPKKNKKNKKDAPKQGLKHWLRKKLGTECLVSAEKKRQLQGGRRSAPSLEREKRKQKALEKKGKCKGHKSRNLLANTRGGSETKRKREVVYEKCMVTQRRIPGKEKF